MNKKQLVAGQVALAKEIENWDYDASVKKIRGIKDQWGKLTLELVRELYLAKQFLTNQKGQRRDPDAPGYISYTWDSYCNEIGIVRQYADYHVNKLFVPKEYSSSGADMLTLDNQAKEDTTAQKALMESRIEKVLGGAKRPANWTDKEESELTRRLENERFKERVARYGNIAAINTKKDYFAEAMKHSKDIVNFKLETPEQIKAQMNIFHHIESYLDIYKDPEMKARAAFNLALKTRNLSNELAEQNYQYAEAASEKESEHDS